MISNSIPRNNTRAIYTGRFLLVSNVPIFSCRTVATKVEWSWTIDLEQVVKKIRMIEIRIVDNDKR